MASYTIALYMRLSLEDEKYDSLSIPNQRLMLREKAMSLPEWDGAEILEFVDNGYTGTNFERPAVQQMLSMVNLGRINCIMVKDLSRFGRNSIETGYFIEKIFPLYHTRFIAVSDNFDTATLNGATGGIDVAFKYLINEFYSRDMSVKSKTAKYARMRRGEYQSKICIYGYRKGDEGIMVPDEAVADNVRMIFQMAADGKPAGDIARYLTEQKILTPGDYKAKTLNTHYDISRARGVWQRSAVLRIIYDEQYTGTYIIGRKENIAVGSTKMRRKPESEWVKIPNHHEPIISKELFDKANGNIKRFTMNKQIRSYPLRGMVYCGCCDHAMNRRNDILYACEFGKSAVDLECSDLKIRIKDLEKVVFDTIKAQAQCFFDTDTDIADNLVKYSAELEEHEKKLKLLQTTKRELYEQFILGLLDAETYKIKKAELDAQLTEEKNICAAVAERTKAMQDDYNDSVMSREIADEINASDALTQALAERLIRRVYIFPNNRVEIQYKTRSFFKGG